MPTARSHPQPHDPHYVKGHLSWLLDWPEILRLSRDRATPAHVGATGRVGVRMLLHDEGNGDKPVTTAAAVFDVVEAS